MIRPDIEASSLAGSTSLEHIPVLLVEAVTHLLGDAAANRAAPAVFVDATFGRGGHSRALLEKLAADDRLIGLDRDPEAVAAGHHLAATDSRFSIHQARFSQIEKILQDIGTTAVQGLLLDIGVSSPQLDLPTRGFSFSADGPLDMRMNPAEGLSAAEWLNAAAEEDIAKVLWIHGEERQSRRIARAIVAARPLHTTAELASIVAEVSPRPKGVQRKHPATKTFQAVRIFVNEEASELDHGLQQAFDALAVGGRLAVISFHSLEDRKVKHAFRHLSQPPKLPRRLPVRELEQTVPGRLVAGPIKPSLAELAANPRARSANLRVIEKVRAMEKVR